MRFIIPAHPRPGDAYRQPYFQRGKALDEVRVLSLSGRLTSFGTFLRLLITSERSPLEPQTDRRFQPNPGVSLSRLRLPGAEAVRSTADRLRN